MDLVDLKGYHCFISSIATCDDYDDALGRHHENCISSLSPKEHWILLDSAAAALRCPLGFAPDYPLLSVGKNPPTLKSVTGKPLNINRRKLIRYDALGVTLFTNLLFVMFLFVL